VSASGADITVYEKPTCTTCRSLSSLLIERGIDFEKVDYFIDPLDEEKLRSLLAKARLGPRDVLRTKEPAYRELGLADENVSDAEVLQALVERPELLQRPIVERGERAVLARPADRVLELL
jgi:arsenate reductase